MRPERDNHTYLYTLYRNKDDKLLILDGRGYECAEAMGISYQWFYKLMCKKGGRNSKWTVTRRRKGEEEEEEDE